MHDDRQGRSVHAWRTLGVVGPPVTTAGMLPIIQASTDDNDTFTTVINCFVDI